MKKPYELRGGAVKPAVSLTFDLEWWGRAHMVRPGAAHFPDGLRADQEATDKILEILGTQQLEATFFVVAGDWPPEDIKRIAKQGHEIASHSVTHPHMAKLGRSRWKEELRESKDQLEQVIGKRVSGFRAPSWSIPYDRYEEWMEAVGEEGYEYDSSVSSFKSPLYGDGRFPTKPERFKNGVVEFPLPTLGWPKAPWVGGFYFRVIPLRLLSLWVGQEIPSFFYFHPWEFYPRKTESDTLLGRASLRYGKLSALRKLESLITIINARAKVQTLRKQAANKI